MSGDESARVVVWVATLRTGARDGATLLGALQQLGDVTSDRAAGAVSAAVAAAGAIPPLVALVRLHPPPLRLLLPLYRHIERESCFPVGGIPLHDSSCAVLWHTQQGVLARQLTPAL